MTFTAKTTWFPWLSQAKTNISRWIVFCCGLGTVAGAVAIIMSSKANKLIAEDPDGYSDVKNVKIGRKCAMIGLGLQVLGFIVWIFISFILPLLMALAF